MSDRDALVRNAVQFLEVGGSISYGDWLAIPFEHRSVLVEAREIIDDRVTDALSKIRPLAGSDDDDWESDERGSCLAAAERLVGV